MINIQIFIKSYWEYYLELESQFIDTKRFVDFDDTNAKTFSIEYLKLYQAVCSEIDVVGKEIAININPNFKTNNANIKKWGYEVQQHFPTLKNINILFNKKISVQPFQNWEYEYAINKKGNKYLRLANKKDSIKWWKSYNAVKHQRIGLITGTKNFELANQKNLIISFSALYLLETLFINDLLENETEKIPIKNSKIFQIK